MFECGASKRAHCFWDGFGKHSCVDCNLYPHCPASNGYADPDIDCDINSHTQPNEHTAANRNSHVSADCDGNYPTAYAFKQGCDLDLSHPA